MRAPCIVTVLLLSCHPIDGQRPVMVAHRGASRDAPENTIPAFQLAWKQGADAIEGDFRLTKDGHIVCIHDQDTDRVAKKNLLVGESTLQELRRLDVGAHHSERYRGTLIPTLAEVFATVPEAGKVYIEIKGGKEMVPRLLDEIMSSGLEQDQIMVMAFDEDLIQQVKSRAPQVKTSWLARIKRDAAGKLNPPLGAALRTLRRIKADGLGSSKHVTERFARGVQKRGYDWHVWTIDDRDSARRFITWGADSIITNVPGDLRHSLDQALAAGAGKPKSTRQ